MAAVSLNGVKTSSQAYLEGKAVKETRALMAELCRHFYKLGWVSGTGGSISIKVHDDSIPKPQQLILMSPSGVQKERMEPEDMYVLSHSGSILAAPSPKPYPHKPPKCTDCDPLFMKAYEKREAGAVVHSHGVESCIVTMINPLSKEFRITHMEMIKGIKGHGYYDELVVPIIENTAYEYQLTESFAKAIEDYPKATAVLVRNHGIFVWGDTWISAKTQSECYHYLFDAAIKLHQMGLDWSTPNHGPIQSARRGLSIAGDSNLSVKARKSNGDIDPFPRCVVLDIEGTTTPISFVSEILFPYARDNVGRHLLATYDTPETKEDIKLLRAQVESDLDQGIAGAVPIPPDDAGKEEVIAALVANVDAMIKADRKITALKELQGHIWQTGYENNELEGIVFDDVPEALEKWHALGIKVPMVGPWVYAGLPSYRLDSGYYPTEEEFLCNTCLPLPATHHILISFILPWNKRETRSYVEISQSLGVDKPSDILFLTDVVQEATAAKAAGLEVIISIRPGNGPLPENHGFKTIKSFSEI
ncbi:putative bifunctional methylthioribulose-1-phosphate dehydratase/enolase-phosphatase E1 [Sesbania bispinosa]|nr:putative bifunctional methylthioribulose-1-phosphate dehydratase/enolase-phosphatase E1 [Sesbania bispinosa]